MPADKDREALRALLDSGPADQRAATKLALTEELEAARAQGNTKKQNEIGPKLAAINKDIQAALAKLRASMVAAIELARSTADEEGRMAKLVAAFENCALTQVIAHHDFNDAATIDHAIEHKHTIAAMLDAMGPGKRAVLSKLLESPFAGVRASAGAHLLNADLLRERVLPILRDIEQNVAGSAGWTAFWALSPHDHGAWLTGEAGGLKP
jgi:hypothetical protein